MRRLVLICLSGLALCPAAAASSSVEVASAGLQLTVPAGWHADRNKLLACDPERLLLLSSEPIRTARSGGLRRPSRGQVLIFVVEDHANLPSGDLQRPARFSVDWSRLTLLEGPCGTPKTPASMHWFRDHGRYLGLLVYPGPHPSAATRAQTTAVMDSLRVTGQFILP